MTSTMKGWQYTAIKGTMEDSIVLTDVPKPTRSSLKKGQIIVKIFSAAINPVDFKLPESNLASMVVKPPAIPGLDFCGEVVEVFGSETTFKPGELVFGAFSRTQKWGTLGQYIAITSSECAQLPPGINIDDAAAIGTAAMTAIRSLISDVVKPGSQVFINGGSGGVGTFTIQFAKILGAKITTTCSTGNVELCKSLGADRVIDYRKVDIVSELEKGGPIFDLAIDNAATPPQLYECSDKFLKSGGTFAQVAVAGTIGSMGVQLRRMLVPSMLGGGPRRFCFVHTKTTTDQLAQIGHWMAEGKARSVVDKVFEFKDVPKAFTYLRSGRAKGKVVIHIEKWVSSRPNEL